MPKIKLLTSYLDWPAGTEIEQDKQKCDELVALKRAEYVKTGKYENKMMTTDNGLTCECGKTFKSEQGLKIHQARFCNKK